MRYQKAEFDAKLINSRIRDLTDQLAKEAGITEKQARTVLKTLHIDKLPENLGSMYGILSDPKAVNALGMSHEAAGIMLRDLNPENISLQNLRVGIKIPSGSSIIV